MYQNTLKERPVVKYKYRVILTHKRPHLDEIAAILRLRRKGEKLYPGIHDADVRYLSTEHLPNHVTPEVMEARGVLPVGVGGGDLDEHPMGGKERKKGKCAATLLENKLGITHGDDPAWHRILDEVAHCDLTAQVKPTQLASLVILRYRQLGDNQSYARVRRWATDALNALYKCGAHRPERGTCRGLKEVFEKMARRNDWVKESAGEDAQKRNRAYDQARQFVAQSQGNAHTCLTELAHLHRCMWNVFPKDADIWCETILSEIVADCQMFFRAVDEVNACEDIAEIDLGGCSVPLLVIRSDNELAGKAARSKWTGRYGLTVQRNCRGNVYIALNTLDDCVQKVGANMDNFVRMTRCLESSKEGVVAEGWWEKLAEDGTILVASRWHYMRHGNMLLNGSTTTPHVPPTKLTDAELADIANHAFTEDGVNEWCARMNVDRTKQEEMPYQLQKPPEKNPESASLDELDRILDTAIRENGNNNH